MKEQLAEEYAQDKSSSEVFKKAHIEDFIAGFEACQKYLTQFQKGEMVQVTDKCHRLTNFWFEREFIQEDSDGKFACRQIDGRICRWDYIRKSIR